MYKPYFKENKLKEESIEGRELFLYVTNDRELYRRMITPIIKNIKSKLAKGKFDKNLAVKGFMYAVDAGAKQYVKDYGGDVRNMFPKPVRMEVAKEMVDYYMDEIEG